MKDYLVTPGSALTLSSGAPAVAFDVVSLDPDNAHDARLLRSGRFIERGGLSFAGASDEELAELVAGNTAPDVLAAVGDDDELAARVLKAETAGKDRKTITEPLANKETSES